MNKPNQENATSTGRKTIVAGATGLVGSHILNELLNDDTVAEVHVLGRRELSVRHHKLTMHVVDFRAIPALPTVGEIYLALGTTIRQAGSQAAFRAVDFDAGLAVAKAGIAAGARRIGVVSAMQADANSSLFYNRVKGELEDALSGLSLEGLVIVRPTFMTGDRSVLNQPTRFGEKIGIWLSLLLSPVLPANYRPVSAQRVAQALLTNVPISKGKKVLLSGEIQLQPAKN